MLHLLNSIPQQQADWQLLESMLSAGDSVLFYEEAVALVMSAEAMPVLLAWLHQGVKLLALENQSGEDLAIPHSLQGQVLVLNWDGVVDLVANGEGVHSL